jgi:hypothetical protein
MQVVMVVTLTLLRASARMGRGVPAVMTIMTSGRQMRCITLECMKCTLLVRQSVAGLPLSWSISAT